MDDLIAGIEAAPKDTGVLELIVRRPSAGEREVLEEGELTPTDGLVGDRWASTVDRQLTLMNARAIAAVAGPDKANWPPAGDQLYVDLDLSEDHAPAGTRLRIGDTVVVEVSAAPHTGCAKFRRRYGDDAVALVNSPDGLRLRARGINARVIEPGTVRVGDPVTKLPPPRTPA